MKTEKTGQRDSVYCNKEARWTDLKKEEEKFVPLSLWGGCRAESTRFHATEKLNKVFAVKYSRLDMALLVKITPTMCKIKFCSSDI